MHLDDAEVLQLVDGFGDDVGTGELDVGIDPGDVFPVWRQAGDADVDQVLLVPDFMIWDAGGYAWGWRAG